MNPTALASALNDAALPESLAARLVLARAGIDGRLVFTTSFGLEDQVLAHVLAESGVAAEVATLDTGRLFPETYAVWAATEARYGLRVRAFYPEAAALEALVAGQGIDGFYESVGARKACCDVRKVAPLGRALAGAAGWITGLRANQSGPRAATSFAEADTARGLVKINPLFDRTRAELAAFAARHGVPVNALHGRGFPSIGCAPCTRAVAPGEDERAGRWWWEQGGMQECGLHLGPDGRLVRRQQKETVA